jgi:hypothetical protein
MGVSGWSDQPLLLQFRRENDDCLLIRWECGRSDQPLFQFRRGTDDCLLIRSV